MTPSGEQGENREATATETSPPPRPWRVWVSPRPVPAQLDFPLMRIGLASTARRNGITIADQSGWARHSRSMLGYMQIDDGWDDNAAASLA